jgi:hypothetical protein
MPAPGTPTVVYPTGGIVVDCRRPWDAWIDVDATRIALEVEIVVPTTLVKVYLSGLKTVTLTRRLRIPSDVGCVPGSPYQIRFRAANASGASAFSALASFTAKSVDLYRPFLPYSTWRDRQ